MRIVNLVENTEGKSGCRTEHGLCLYVETEKHRLLVDTGASGLFLENAARLGIDPERIDLVILSHGHYDHGGGIPDFIRRNPHANIYMQDGADGNFYSMSGEPHYIGLPREILDLPQLVRVQGTMELGEELMLYSDIPFEVKMPSANKALRIKQEDEYVQDDFRHEQYLVIRQGRQRIRKQRTEQGIDHIH